MLEIKQTKYQSVTITTNLTSGLKVEPKELDNTYDVCDGIQFTEITNGGITNGDYDVGIRTNNGEVIEPVPIQAVATTKNDGSDPNKRFVDVLFDCKSGNKAKLELNLPVAPGAAVVVKATFRLRRLLKPISIPAN